MAAPHVRGQVRGRGQHTRVTNVREDSTITVKAPTRAFSLFNIVQLLLHCITLYVFIFYLFRAIRHLRSGPRFEVDCTEILQPLERVKCISKKTAGDYSGQEEDFKILGPGDLAEGRTYDQVENYEDYILYDDFLLDKTGVNKTFTWHPIIINGWDFV